MTPVCVCVCVCVLLFAPFLRDAARFCTLLFVSEFQVCGCLSSAPCTLPPAGYFCFFWFAAAPLLVARRAPVRRGTEEQKQGNDSPPFVPVSKFVCARQGRKQLARKGDRKKKSDFLKVGV